MKEETKEEEKRYFPINGVDAEKINFLISSSWGDREIVEALSKAGWTDVRIGKALKAAGWDDGRIITISLQL